MPWALDFTPDDAAFPPFPQDRFIYPYQPAQGGTTRFLLWQTTDWDPALRFWNLPFDLAFPAWLRTVDPSLPSIQAACEFAALHSLWKADRSTPSALVLAALGNADLAWWIDPNTTPTAAARDAANNAVRVEIEQLKMLMQDDRDRYLAEIEAQADGLADYIIHFVGADRARHPWTAELIGCALAIGNVAYMHYKSFYRRVRPSFLCPGLVPPFGPPSHPSFPSGHSFLGHLIALVLLEIPALAERFGIFEVLPSETTLYKHGDPGRKPISVSEVTGGSAITSPLLWLAQRLAKNRERLGVHYPSDSSGSRHLAAEIWRALFYRDGSATVSCPTLLMALRRAAAEWND